MTAPVSGRSCVWFHSTVVEHWVEAERPQVRDFDGDGPLHHAELRRARRGRKRTEAASSECRFVVRDATGSVVVDPRVLRAEGLPVSVRDSVARAAVPGAVAVNFGAGADRMRRSSRYERSETVLVPGQHVVISGRVRHERDGTPVLAARRVSRRAERAATGDRGRRGLRLGWLVGVLSAVTGVAALLAGTRH
ncbi:GIDE domain-containing protein [Yinghuangia aomiensis]